MASSRTDRVAALPYLTECLRCGSRRLESGDLVGHYGFRKAVFNPKHLNGLKSFFGIGKLDVEHKAVVCADCGLLMGQTNAKKATRRLKTPEA